MLKYAVKILAAAFILAALTNTGCTMANFNLFQARGPLKEFVLEGEARGKVLVIPIRGFISSGPKEELLSTKPSVVREVVSQLLLAEKDKNIKAIILQINSPGGTVTACDMLYYELMEFKKRTGVKIIAAMMDVAASGGYYVSLPADYILAHPTTITGSIGVIFQRPVVAGFMDKVGLAVDVSVSGKNKDMGSPYRKSTEEERRIIQELTDALGQRFRDLVSKHRNLTGDSLAEAATARVFLAREALELGLIDQIGYLNDAKAKAREAAGLPENAKVVVYRRVESPNDNIYNTSFSGFEGTPKSLIDVRLPDATAFLNAGFYYVWSPADVDR